MCTHVDGHLVDMDTFLDAELGNKHVESGIEDANDLCLTDDRSVTLGKICNKDAKIQMRRLLLSELSGLFLSVERLRNLPRVNL